ncbi:hypothetical protein RHMOL_Rhmol06G0046800 [Rhododendron molle]|uniref:Uncharacterized protein n=1 Tax=Rhododendron molle TaxID=49168 RepID=A0ACC0NAQ6_RHOML|nr:hypothetical protein RHMOL_Rhmol06G0046800 [Rhododendron molle]
MNDHQMANHALNILLDYQRRSFEAVWIKYIYREANHCADALSIGALICGGRYIYLPLYS